MTLVIPLHMKLVIGWDCITPFKVAALDWETT